MLGSRAEPTEANEPINWKDLVWIFQNVDTHGHFQSYSIWCKAKTFSVISAMYECISYVNLIVSFN